MQQFRPPLFPFQKCPLNSSKSNPNSHFWHWPNSLICMENIKAMNTGIQLKDYKTPLGKAYVMVLKILYIIFIFMQDFNVLYYILYGALAVVGTVFHPFFFTFHLTAILMRYPTLKNVVMSIYLPRKQLLLTFLLFIVLEYSFAVVGYSVYSVDYGGRCESLLYCFLTTFD